MGASTKAGVPPGTVPVRGQVGDMLGPVPPGVTPLSDIGGQLRDALGVIGAAGIPPVALIRGVIERRNPAEIAMENAVDLGRGLLGYTTPPFRQHVQDIAGRPTESGQGAADVLATAIGPGLVGAGSRQAFLRGGKAVYDVGGRLDNLAMRLEEMALPPMRMVYRLGPEKLPIDTPEQLQRVASLAGKTPGEIIMESDIIESAPTLVNKILARLDPEGSLPSRALHASREVREFGRLIGNMVVPRSARGGRFAEVRYPSALDEEVQAFTAAQIHKTRSGRDEEKKNER